MTIDSPSGISNGFVVPTGSVNEEFANWIFKSVECICILCFVAVFIDMIDTSGPVSKYAITSLF